jgi:hypothetical protein
VLTPQQPTSRGITIVDDRDIERLVTGQGI